MPTAEYVEVRGSFFYKNGGVAESRAVAESLEPLAVWLSADCFPIPIYKDFCLSFKDDGLGVVLRLLEVEVSGLVVKNWLVFLDHPSGLRLRRSYVRHGGGHRLVSQFRRHGAYEGAVMMGIVESKGDAPPGTTARRDGMEEAERRNNMEIKKSCLILKSPWL